MRRPNKEDKAAWSAVGAAVMAVGGGGAVAWWLAAEPASSDIPKWPAYVLCALALAGLYVLLAPLLGWWGWRTAARDVAGEADPPVSSASAGGGPVAQLLEKASAYVAELTTPRISSVPRRRASSELRRAAAGARAESSAAADLGLSLAKTTDPVAAGKLEEELRQLL